MSLQVDPAPLPAPPLRHRRWIPVAAIAVVLAAVTSGGYLTASALGEIRGGAVDVTATVRVTPLPGWELAGRSADPDRIRLTSGSTSLDVAAFPFDGTDVELLRWYVENILEPDAEQFQVSEEVELVPLASGLTGSRIAYVGLFGDVQAPIEGEVTAVVSPSGEGVIFDGWAPAGQLQFEIDEIDEMIERAEIA
ncbi:MAG TPA: hypothetical protein VFP13_09660 [Actinomycetota bacterium]|nr:hypothetical protein [Actinomycetota bacterium]